MTNYKQSLQFTEASLQFADRLKSEADAYKNASALAREVGVVEGTVRKWTNGISQPKIGETVALARALRVNLLWLATGEGPKHPGEPAAPGQIDLKSLQLALEMVEQALETRRRVTDPENKAQIVAAVYDLFAGNQPVEKAKVLKLIKTMA
jgi:transcriptional regulator with XRE-family HTH domain